MGTRQIVFGVAIVALTAALGGYYAWRQWQTLRRLRADATLPEDERAFLRGLARRRLIGSAVLLLFAGLFVGMFFLEGPAYRLEQEAKEAKEAREQHDERPEMNASQKDFLRLYGGYWIAVLLLLLAIIGLAGYEFFVIRRYSVQHLRRIQDERRAMIASETARLRRDRNGHA